MGEAAASAASALEKAARDEDADVRAQAAHALGVVMHHATEDHILLTLTEDVDPSVRAAAVEALGKRGDTDQEIVGALLRALSDPADPVKVEATKALPPWSDQRSRPSTAYVPCSTPTVLGCRFTPRWVWVGSVRPPLKRARHCCAAQTAELSVREQAMRTW